MVIAIVVTHRVVVASRRFQAIGDNRSVRLKSVNITQKISFYRRNLLHQREIMDGKNAEYDNIASEFKANIGLDSRDPTEYYTFEKFILGPLLNARGLLTEKRVLDIACGEGLYTRRLKAFDCDYILGVDISSEMIKLARDAELKDPKGIEYMVADVNQLPIPEKPFDLVTAVFLLNYARTRKELLKMANIIYAQLGKNTHFIGFTNNIAGSTKGFNMTKYRFFRHVKDPSEDGIIPEGTEVFITLLNMENKPACTFSTYYLSQKTYEEVFKEAGFTKFEWIPIQCDPAASNKEFYDDLIESASEIGFIASK
ncbi:unnamed protein product [Rotaria sp. Silwood2]|nr:unnamed protein product [Rotaria sp. Silwood2]CAF3338205.1 unnamed protein product [Rotaria sp. Silwood2]CAF4414173.1 unnamed protein product [Rotaria sp. Silwood2]CAF4448396.1 unnamed protein product [Rotaria sp. Silwood2]